MRKAGEVLTPLLRRLGLERGISLLRVRDSWESIVGSHLAPHIAPADLSSGELLVIVDTPMRMQQLHFLRQDFLKKLSPFGVSALKFRVGRIHSRPASLPEPPKKEKSLSSEDRDYIDRLVADIADSELRNAVRRTAEKSLSR